MDLVNYAILGGQQFAIREGKHTVVHLIMQLHKYYKGHNMICQWIYGV
jgi:hypothetical protein